MAKKRMTTTQITDSDDFTSLTSTQQALYWRLNSHADDDGFNNQVRTDMCIAKATEDDLKVLIDKKFIYKFDNVILIKHWKLANHIQRDRYVPSVYQEYLEKVYVKDNEAYTLNEGQKASAKAEEPKSNKEYDGLPEELVDALLEFEKMRNKIKKPLTSRAKKMIISKVQKLSNGDVKTQIDILNQSIMHCWMDIYPLKNNNSKEKVSVGDILDL